MNIILTIFLIAVSTLLLYKYHKTSQILIHCSSQKERHKQWKINRHKIYYLLGFIFALLVFTFYLINRNFEKIDNQNRNLISKIEKVDNKLNEITQLNEKLIEDKWTNKYDDYSAKLNEDKKFSNLSTLGLCISLLALIGGIYWKKRSVVYVSAVTGILATTTSVMSKSLLIKASLKLDPQFEITIGNNGDTVKSLNYEYDTLYVMTFHSGNDTLERNNNINAVIDRLSKSNHRYELLELTGMYDQRELGPISRRTFGTNENLASARVKYIEKIIKEKVKFVKPPKFTIKTSGPNDFTNSLDTLVLSKNRAVIVSGKYLRNE